MKKATIIVLIIVYFGLNPLLSYLYPTDSLHDVDCFNYSKVGVYNLIIGTLSFFILKSKSYFNILVYILICITFYNAIKLIIFRDNEINCVDYVVLFIVFSIINILSYYVKKLTK